jgi:uncharacterized protein (DUF849 family)
MLEAALNGTRSISDHPALPRTAGELERAGRAAIHAGAQALHFHVRERDGRESIAGPDVAEAVIAMRTVGAPFGVSTGAWIISDPEQRHTVVAGWTVLPDFASVNFDEPGAVPLAALLLERGMAIEAGVANPFAAEQLVASRLADRCLRIMFEPREKVVREALEMVDSMERILDAAGVRAPRLLHGLDQTAWPLLDEAGRRGYSTRIGLEDILVLPDGTVARDNADLVRVAGKRLARQ